MGEEITVQSVEIINGGTIQIDIWFVKQCRRERVFIEGEKFFSMFGKAMGKKSLEEAERWEKENLILNDQKSND